MKQLHLDIESTSDLKLGSKDDGVNVYVYAAHPSTRIICLSYKIDDGETKTWLPWQLPPEDLFYALKNPDVTVHAHNAGFERVMWPIVMRGGVPDVEKSRWRCSYARACSLGLVPNLADVATALRLNFRKDEEGKKLMKRMATTKGFLESSREDLERLVKYCERDVDVEVEASAAMGPLCDNELAVWQFDQDVNDAGIPIDHKLCTGVIEIVRRAQSRLGTEISELTDDVVTKPTQGARIIKWCGENGYEIDNCTKETIEDALLDDECPPKVRRILEMRQLGSKSSTAKFQKMLNTSSEDSRVRGTLGYHIATTGRWGGKGFQPQNLTKTSFSDDETQELVESFRNLDEQEILRITNGRVLEGGKSVVRAAIEAPKDHSLVVFDLGQIEARGLAVEAGQYDLIQAFERDEPIYCKFAEKIYGREVIKGVHKPERAVGKVGVLGLGYQMGAARFQGTVKSWTGMHVDEDFAADVVSTYRKTYDKIPAFWKQMEHEATTLTGRFWSEGLWTFCRLPSGRHIPYFNGRNAEGKYGNTQLKYQRPKDGRMFWTQAYGGLLTENYIQGMCRDILASVMIRLQKLGLKVIFHVHDEVIVECLTRDAEDVYNVVEQEMVRRVDWFSQVPLACDGFITKRFRK